MPVARPLPTLPPSCPRPPTSISGARRPAQALFPVACAVPLPSQSQTRALLGLVHQARWASAFSRATLMALSKCRGISSDARTARHAGVSAHASCRAIPAVAGTLLFATAPIFDSVPPLRALFSSSRRLGGLCGFSFHPFTVLLLFRYRPVFARLASIRVFEKRTTTQLASPALHRPSCLVQV